MNFKGWHRTSVINFPDHIATTVFTAGCSFRCPMCHNVELVLHPDRQPTLQTVVIEQYLRHRAGLITGVCITGGEPTLQPDLAYFCQQVKRLGLAVKVDTNGYHPEALANLLQSNLVDYIAMDIKAPPAKYAQLAGLDSVDITRIERSLAHLRASDCTYEVRTTVVPTLLTAADLIAVAHWLADLGLARVPYVLQQFRSRNTLDPALRDGTPYSVTQLQTFAQQIQEILSYVTVRSH